MYGPPNEPLIFNGIENIPSVGKKANWAIKWINDINIQLSPPTPTPTSQPTDSPVP